jgi:hypothetical protein
LWIRNDFFSDPDQDPTLKLVSGPTLHDFFSNILNINFTFVSPSCKCVRLHIMTRYKLYRVNIYLTKRNLYFLI